MEKLLQIKQERPTTINLSSTQYLTDAFNRIPSNANINKGRCGIGGTTMELNDNRHSVIIVPNISIVLDKKKAYKDLICVYGDVSVAEIVHQLETFFESNPSGYLKVMSTHDSFHKLISASKKTGFDIFNDCFLLLDESHAIATEGTYRPNITRPFDYFFQFKHKTMMSATPYEFSDPRFNGLREIKIITNHLNDEVNVVFSDYILATLKSMVQQVRELDKGNLHIFYNSVTSIKQFLHLIGVCNGDVNIFCATNDENRGKLDEFADFVKNMDDHEEMPINRINLYTTKYYEGWDLNDEKAILVIVSDTDVEHTCIGITNKAAQAIGRLRNKALGVYHVTNTFDNEDILSKEQIITLCNDDVQKKIDYYNHTVDYWVARDQTALDMIGHVRGAVNQFSVINPSSEKASLDYNKFDAIVNSRIALSHYHNRETVINAWKEANFRVKSAVSHILMTKKDELLLLNKRKGESKKNRLIFEKFRDLDFEIQNRETSKDEGGGLLINFGILEEFDTLKRTYPHLFKYYDGLGFDKAKQLKFNTKQLKQEYLIAKASEIEVSKEVKESIGLYFKQGNFYSSTYTKEQLSNILQGFDINRTVTGADINRYFVAKETSKRVNGITTKGYQLVMERV